MGRAILAAAAYLIALALFSQGPLGLVRVIGPRLHRALDLVLVVGLAISPVFVRGDLDVSGVIVVETLAIVGLRLTLRTQYVPAPAALAPAPAAAAKPPAARPAAEAGVADETESADPAPAPARSTAEAGNDEDEAQPEPAEPKKTVPSTAWTLGVLAARAQRRRGAGTDGAVGDHARRLGAAIGRANRRRRD
jgi:hypothetical protein